VRAKPGKTCEKEEEEVSNVFYLNLFESLTLSFFFFCRILAWERWAIA